MSLLDLPLLSDLNLMVLGDLFLTVAFYLILCFAIAYGIFFFLKKRDITIPGWIGIALLVTLVVLRLITITELNLEMYREPKLDLILGAAILSVLFFLQKKERPVPHKKQKIDWKDGVAVAILLGLVLVSFGDLSNYRLATDEHYQFEAAYGFLETGEFVRWDFVHDAPLLSYPEGEKIMYARAWMNTWLMAKSMEIFGRTPFSARLPSALFFTLFVLGIYAVIRFWKHDVWFGLFVALVFLFSDTFLYQGMMIRMYAPFLFFYGATTWLWFQTLRLSLQKTPFWMRASLGLGAISTSLIAFHLLDSAGLFGLAFLGFCCFELLMQLRSSGVRSRPTIVLGIWVSLGILGMVTGLLLNSRYQLVNPELLHYLHTINFEYEHFAFLDFAFFEFVIALFFLSVVWSLKKSMAHRFIALIPIPLFILFISFISHFEYPRYFFVATIFVILSVCITLYELIKRLQLKPGATVKFLPVAFCAMILLPIPPFVIPSHSEHKSKLIEGRLNILDEEIVYDYVKTHKKEGEVVLSFPFRSYYWGEDRDLITLDLREQFPQAKKKKQLKRYMEQQTAGWILVRRTARLDISPDRKFLAKFATEIDPAEIGTDVYRVFYYDFTELID